MGLVKTNKGENEIEVAVPTAGTDINTAYEDGRCVVDQTTEGEKMWRRHLPRRIIIGQSVRRLSFSSACHLSRSSTWVNPVRSTTNRCAKRSDANKTVNGYLIFILYSGFLLARALSSLLCEQLAVLDACHPSLLLFARLIAVEGD